MIDVVCTKNREPSLPAASEVGGGETCARRARPRARCAVRGACSECTERGWPWRSRQRRAGQGRADRAAICARARAHPRPEEVGWHLGRVRAVRNCVRAFAIAERVRGRGRRVVFGGEAVRWRHVGHVRRVRRAHRCLSAHGRDHPSARSEGPRVALWWLPGSHPRRLADDCDRAASPDCDRPPCSHGHVGTPAAVNGTK